MDLLDLGGKIALVTGAGQGIGRQTALLLAAFGAKVVVNDIQADRADAVAQEIIASHGPEMAMGAGGDVTDFASVMALAKTARSRFGRVDILVNNAGNAGADGIQPERRAFWEQDPEEWEPWLRINLLGVMHCCRAFLPDMVVAGAGSVITVISDAGRVGEADLEPYSAAKAGAAGFTRAIARKLGRHNVRANCVSIGTTRTPTTERAFADAEWVRRASARYVLRRLGEPGEIANMILFLASDAAAWITGQTYPVNGGYDMAM